MMEGGGLFPHPPAGLEHRPRMDIPLEEVPTVLVQGGEALVEHGA